MKFTFLKALTQTSLLERLSLISISNVMPEGFTSLPCFLSKVATMDSEAFIKKTNEPAERVPFHLHKEDLFDHRIITSVPSKEGKKRQRQRGSLQVKGTSALTAEPTPALVPGHLTPRHGEFGLWNSSGVL